MKKQRLTDERVSAAFGRLCVETCRLCWRSTIWRQPPSGGCVLKPHRHEEQYVLPSAAFGRLCVETCRKRSSKRFLFPAAFGRLCVETKQCEGLHTKTIPAAFGWLYVETACHFFFAVPMVLLNQLLAPVQFLAQGFVVLVMRGVQHAQVVVVAAQGDDVFALHIDK